MFKMACAKLDNDRVEELKEEKSGSRKNVERSIHTYVCIQEMPPKRFLINL